MPRYLKGILLATILSSANLLADTTIMTFNIRYGSAADGFNSWFWRRSLLMDTIHAHSPDILGMQEVITSQQNYISNRLSDYGVYGVGRDDGSNRGERCTILFKNSKFTELNRGTFWLSETPDMVGSRGWDASLPRIASWLQLEHLETGERWLVLNTHFDHLGRKARVESAKLIRRQIDTMGNFNHVLLLGDFNFNETASAYQILSETDNYSIPLKDGYRTIQPTPTGNEATYHNFQGTTSGRPIDMIWLSANTTIVDALIDRNHSGTRYPSDHYPVVVTVEDN